LKKNIITIGQTQDIDSNWLVGSKIFIHQELHQSARWSMGEIAHVFILLAKLASLELSFKYFLAAVQVLQPCARANSLVETLEDHRPRNQSFYEHEIFYVKVVCK